MQETGDNQLTAYQLHEHNFSIPCTIAIFDIQACNCGLATYYNKLDCSTSIAELFLSYTSIERVYAWTGAAIFVRYGFNVGRDGEYYEYVREQQPRLVGKYTIPLQY